MKRIVKFILAMTIDYNSKKYTQEDYMNLVLSDKI